MPNGLIVDIDGTLVDSNYQHALAWYEAFRRHGHILPVWRIHRHVGMGGDQLIAAVAGQDVEDADGGTLREAHDEIYQGMIANVSAFTGARELLVELREAGYEAVLASSASEGEVDHYLDLLDAREI